MAATATKRELLLKAPVRRNNNERNDNSMI